MSLLRNAEGENFDIAIFDAFELPRCRAPMALPVFLGQTLEAIALNRARLPRHPGQIILPGETITISVPYEGDCPNLSIGRKEGAGVGAGSDRHVSH